MNPALQNALYSSLMNGAQNQDMVSSPSNMPGRIGPMPAYQDMQENYEPAMNVGNPISSGSMAAIQAHKNSVGMNEQEQRNAEGLAIQRFFANMSASRNPDQLGRINESFSPAVQTYLAEQQRVENLNHSLLELDELRREKEENRMLKREAIAASKKEEDYEAKSRYLENLRASGKIDKDATPLAMMGVNERKDERKRMNGIIHQTGEVPQYLNLVKDLRSIVKDKPYLADDLARIWLTTDDGEARGYINSLMARATNADDRAAIEEYGKKRAQLVSSAIKSAPAKIMTDVHKAQINKAFPDLWMSAKAQNKIFGEMLKEGEEYLKYGRRVKNKLEEGLSIPDYIPHYNFEQQETVLPGTDNMQSSEEGQLANPQEVVKYLREEYPQLGKYPDEYLLKAFEEGKLK